MKRRELIRLLSLSPIALLTSCKPDAIALLDAIVGSAEIIIPLLPGISPADSAAIANYLDAALKIVNDLLSKGVTSASIGQALAEFRNLALPQLSSVLPPDVISLLNAVSLAIANFIQAYDQVPSPAQIRQAQAQIGYATINKDVAHLKARVAVARLALLRR